MDFGIARRVVDTKTMTRTGTLIGTPEYMAPEQVRGEKMLRATVDIFALGCVLYECLTGKSPFVADHIAAMLVRILFEEPAPLENRRPGIPPSLSLLVQKMLAKDPQRRIANAEALLSELAAVYAVADAAVLSSPSTTLVPSRSANTATPFAENEQTLFSLVVASLPEEPNTDSVETTTEFSDPGEAEMIHEHLLVALHAMGLQADFLLDGSLVATVPRTGNVTDQVGLAAQAALFIKELWPEAEVVVATGRGVASDATAVGEVADSAARLLQERKASMIARSVSQHSGILLDPLSAQLLSPRYSVQRSADSALLIGQEREADASRPLLGKPTPCVGRDAELATLDAHLNACVEEAQAQAILVSAPSGIGKSRLRHEFLRRIERRPDPITVLLGRGDLITSGAPYAILGQAIRRFCGLSGGESSQTQRVRISERIARHVPVADQARVACFLCELVGAFWSEDEAPWLRAARKDPKLLVDGISRAFLSWLDAECRVAPVLLLFDDFQWGDPLTLALLEMALREPEASSLLILAFARPEVHDVFSQLRHNQHWLEISLKALSRRACERLIQHVVGKAVSPEILARAVEQSAGNALFLEELIRAMAAGESAASKEVPETVVVMLQARLGKFDVGARRVVRAAAVFGRRFWVGGVAAILERAKDSASMAASLHELEQAEVIEQRQDSHLPGEIEYEFRHGLVRDAAYGLLTESDLLTGHRLAGEFLEAAGIEDTTIIAEHYRRGGDIPRAVQLYLRTGDDAARLGLYPKARQRFEQAQELLTLLPDTLQWRRMRVDILLKQMQSRELTEAFESHLKRLEAGRALLKDPAQNDKLVNEDRLRLARIDYFCGRALYHGGQPAEAIKYYKRVLPVAQELGDHELLMGTAYWRRLASMGAASQKP